MTGQTGQYTIRRRAASAARYGCPPGSILARTSRLQRYLLGAGFLEAPKNCFSRIVSTRTVYRRTPVKPKRQPLTYTRPTPRPTPAPRRDTYYVTDREKETLRLTNKIRAQYSLRPLVLNKRLMAASRRHSLFMRNTGRIGHILSGQPDGVYPHHRAQRFGYRGRIGENLAEYARGYTPAQVMQAWINSPGHLRTMLKPEWRVMGVGDGYTTWTTMFGTDLDRMEVGQYIPYGSYGYGGYQAYGVPGWPNYYGYANAFYFPAKAWRRPPDIQNLYKSPIPIPDVKNYCQGVVKPYCAKFPGDTYCNTYREFCSKHISNS